MIVYAVQVFDDYADGGAVAIFSVYEKAKEYSDSYKLDRSQRVEIVKMEIDNPLYSDNNNFVDYRHG